MPANDDTYRNQPALHIVFAVSSILMLVGIVWMILEDHLREWKVVQREFSELEARKAGLELERAEKDRAGKSPGRLEALQKELDEARKSVDSNRSKIGEIDGRLVRLIGAFQAVDQELSFARADRDSIASIQDIATGEGGSTEAAHAKTKLEAIDKLIAEIRPRWEKAQAEQKAAERERAALEAAVTNAEKSISELLKEERRLAEVRQKKTWTVATMIRGIPVLDAFAAPVQIEQTVLDQLPLDYNFKGVPRFDRCTTCHKAIDSVTRAGGPAFDTTLLEQVKFESRNRNAFKTHSRPDLFAGATSPHNRERFGCTVCHGGQGSATTFLYASHTPTSVEQKEQWTTERHWHDIHYWESPMAPVRFVESACLKCHPNVVELETSARFGNSAPKVVAGYHLVRKYGCFGCHEIGGFKEGRQIGPDLRLEPQTDEDRRRAELDTAQPPGQMRKVGPSLRLLHEKMSSDWVNLWIKSPAGFRPESRMPAFYGQSNNDGSTLGSSADDVARSDVEILAITHYLTSKAVSYRNDVTTVKALDESAFAKLRGRRGELEAKASREKLPEAERTELATLQYQIPLRDVAVAIAASAKIDPADAQQTARGKIAFSQKGCLACHSHSAFPTAQFPQATADHGPDLSNLAAKLRVNDKPNTQWLFNWLKNPRLHHPRGYMPDLQLTDTDAADVTAWLLSIAGDWVAKPAAPKLDEAVLDSLLRLFLEKSMTLSQAAEAIQSGIPTSVAEASRSDESILAAPISVDKKLTYIGKKTIGRMGCFGCHDIPGFETAKPIGTPLYNWGSKALRDPEKLDFGHIHQYLDGTQQRDKAADKPEYDYFAEGLLHHSGVSFLWQKLRDPRSFDYNKSVKVWDDRLRMPRFTFDTDPRRNDEAIQSVMTFVLGLVGDELTPSVYRYLPSGQKLSALRGWSAISRFNCGGCHVLEMPDVVFDKTKVNLANAAARHADEFPIVIAAQTAAARRSAIPGTNLVRAHGMLLGDVPPITLPSEITEDNVQSVQLWEPISIDGKTYLVGDQLAVSEAGAVVPPSSTGVASRPGIGGQFTELLSLLLAKGTSTPPRQLWFRGPPPLIDEGRKVQPSWFHQFLLDPIEIRPGAVLRMPRFNLTSQEAADVVAYFALRDGVETPYEFIRERDETYLANCEARHAEYLSGGWRLLTLVPDVQAGGSADKLCANCHNVGSIVVKGAPEELGPNLRLAPDRLRSPWLEQWIAAPNRLLPYTGMPKNFDLKTARYQQVFKGDGQDQITAARDALINYHRVLQTELTRANVPNRPSGGN